MRIKERLRSIGPGILVTAAFIGPGTITTCSITGASFGYALLWGLSFSVVATIVLQEMAARLGIISQMGLGDAIRFQMKTPFTKIISSVLILSAIVIGNAAYETGNILGATLGVEEITGFSSIAIGDFDLNIWGPIIGLIAFLILSLGSYKFLERILITLVLLMSLAFLITMILIGPELLPIIKGLFVPTLPNDAIFMLMGLIGTTVVPYNLFLHASIAKEKWKTPSDLSAARVDLIIAVILGGVVSMAIVITSAAAFHGIGVEIKGASELASQLRPLLGNLAGIFISFGLFAAGISSAITAPLAAAYAASGILGWKIDLKSPKFKSIWIGILLIGILFSALEFSPIKAIVFAQFANGLLLPIIAIYLLVAMNNKALLKNHTNSKWQNLIGIIVVVATIALGVKSILHVIGLL